MWGTFMLSLTYTAMSVDVYVDVLFLINAGMDCLCLSLAALFCIATIIMPAQIMKIYTVETDIITCGVRYLKYSVASYFLLGLSLTSTIILRNVGQVKLPLYTVFRYSPLAAVMVISAVPAFTLSENSTV